MKIYSFSQQLQLQLSSCSIAKRGTSFPSLFVVLGLVNLELQHTLYLLSWVISVHIFCCPDESGKHCFQVFILLNILLFLSSFIHDDSSILISGILSTDPFGAGHSAVSSFHNLASCGSLCRSLSTKNRNSLDAFT